MTTAIAFGLGAAIFIISTLVAWSQQGFKCTAKINWRYPIGFAVAGTLAVFLIRLIAGE